MSAPAGGHGFRSAILRERRGASEELDPTGRAGGWSVRPKPAPGAEPSDDEEERRWLQTWQANEIRWLNNKVEELERRLRRRRIVSVGAVALGGLALIAAIGFDIASPQLPEAVVAVIETTSPGETPAAGEPGRAPETAQSQADLRTVPVEPAAGEPADAQPLRDEQAPEIRPSPTGRATVPAAPAAGEPGQVAELWRLEAERALMAIIEPVSRPGAPEEPEQAAEIGPPPSEEVPAAAPLNVIGEDEPPADAAESIGGREADGQISQGAAAVGADYYTATGFVNLRDGPRGEAEVVTVIGEGDRVRRLGSEGDWLLVEYDDRATGIVTGWVHGRFLRRVEGPSQGSAPSARSRG